MNAESEARKFLEQGMIESYVDFVYLTNGGMPVAVAPLDSPEEKNCYRGRGRINFDEETILHVTDLLKKAEDFLNEGEIAKSINEYKNVCKMYEEVNDYPIASYFYEKCLTISKQEKNAEGEAESYMGLGLCEEGEHNIAKAQEYYEIALEKALDKNLHAIDKVISEQLIRVYEKLAIDNEGEGDYTRALEYYDKCLNASKRALNTRKEAECYLKLGMTYEKTKELEKSVEALEMYADICKKSGDQDGYSLALKELAERNRQLGNMEASKKCLNELKEVQLTSKEKALESKAEASLKLGMLEFQNKNLQNSVMYFEKEFFEMAKELKDQKLINIGRVNTGVAKGLNKLDLYKDIIKNNYQAFLSWKFKRNPNATKK